MKKPIKIFIWLVVAILGLILIAAIAFFINFRHGIKDMTPAETRAINDSVWSVKDRFVNSYIFKGKDGYLIIDAGLSAKKIRKEMEKIGIKPEEVTALFLTHTDGDHTGATGLFTNAVIYLHKDEEQMINGTTGKTKYAKTKWKYGPYTLLDNNDTFSVSGIKVKIIHTPGHTPGSSCYIIGDDYLATGDNLVVSNGKYEHFIEMFNMNTPEQIKSLTELPDPVSFKYILTGHHGVIKN